MPKVPEEQQAQFNTSNVPGVAFPFRQQMGKVGEAVQGIGGNTENAAGTYNNIADEIQRQHDISTSSTAAAVSGAAHQNMIDQLKIASPDGLMYDANGAPIKNDDAGQTQKTITQAYWEKANADYTQNQENMSPRAAAMYREKMLPEMAQNAIRVQHMSLQLQSDAAEKSIEANSQIDYSEWNTNGPYPKDSPYYTKQETDAAGNTFTNMRQDIGKFSRDLLSRQVDIAQRGPVTGPDGNMAGGLYNTAQIQDKQDKISSEYANTWLNTALNDWLENDKPRDKKQPLSTTALHQLTNLRDIVHGKDPQSQELDGKELPTIANSLSADDRIKWADKLTGMMTQAVKIDKSEYENLFHDVMANAENGKYDVFNLLAHKDIQHLIAARDVFHDTDTPDKKMDELYIPLIVKAGVASLGSASDDNRSGPDQLAHYTKRMNEIALSAQQQAGMQGVKYSEAAGGRILNAMQGAAMAMYQRNEKEKGDDLAKFESQLANGKQDPANPSYRSPVMYRFSKLDQSNLPGMVASRQLPAVLREMEKYTSINHGKNASPQYFPEATYRSLADGINNTENGDMVNKQLESMSDQVGTDKANLIMDQLVSIGKLDPRYKIAMSQGTASERVHMIDDIKSGGAVGEAFESAGGSIKDVSRKASDFLAPWFNYNNMVSSNAPDVEKNNQAVQKLYNSTFMKSFHITKDAAASHLAAQQEITKNLDPISTVGAQHDYPIIGKWGHVGPQMTVQIPKKYSDQEQATIKQNLLVQSALLSRYEVVPPEGISPTIAAKMKEPGWAANNGATWFRTKDPQGQDIYRFMVKQFNPDGSWNSKTLPLVVKGNGDENKRNLDVRESDMLRPNPEMPAPKKLPIFQLGMPMPSAKPLEKGKGAQSAPGLEVNY